MRVLTQVLKKIYQDYAIIYPPAEQIEVHTVASMLLQNNQGYLPSDYRDFLMMTDGMFWNGIEFFSTREHERLNGSFYHRGLLPIQLKYSNNALLKNKIVLGIAPEEIIAYDSFRKEYQIIDKYSYTVFVKFPHFSDVLYFYVRNLLDK